MAFKRYDGCDVRLDNAPTYVHHCFVVFQFTSVGAWAYLRGGFVPLSELMVSVHPLQVVIALGLIVFGQVLNAGIFRAIGHVGVYYGFKLGHVVPWVDGFPFNVVRHPQYVGSVATIWGGALLAAGVVPLPDVILLVFYWTLLYVFTGLMES